MAITAFKAVLTMLIYAIPGYLLVRTKLFGKECISAFAVMLTYVCQPCLVLYAFDGIEMTGQFVLNMVITFFGMLAIFGLMIGGTYLVLRKKQDIPKYRIATISAGFGNVTFMGIPVLEMLLPDCPEARVYSTVAFIAMSALCWTVGSAIITHDKKYIKPSKILLNPGTISFIVVILLTAFSVKLPDVVNSPLKLIGQMSTPICMLVMGARLAVTPRRIFANVSAYISIAVKQLLMPLISFAILFFLPIDQNLKTTMYVLCCMPVASNVLNFAELLGDGREEAACTVLVGTFVSVATLPLMMLLKI